MSFGQVVIGPPGSGKTTYCNGMYQFLTGIGRQVCVINFDPANDVLPYPCSINILELVNLENVMEQLELGPNGALVYAMEYLEKNLDWLVEHLLKYKDYYLIFDCPGQAELYTHYQSLRNVVHILTDKKGFRLCAVHLIDSYYCSSPSTFVSAVLLSLNTMIQLELPHINVLSKLDIIEKYGKLAFGLEFYTDVGNLGYLQDHLDSEPFGKKFSKLNKVLCEMIEDYSLVSFTPVDINNKECLVELVKKIDKATGYIYGSLTEGNESIMTIADASDRQMTTSTASMEETYLKNDEIITDSETKLSHININDWDL